MGRSSFVLGHDFLDGTVLFVGGMPSRWVRTHPQHTAVDAPDWLRRSLAPRETAFTGSAKQ